MVIVKWRGKNEIPTGGKAFAYHPAGDYIQRKVLKIEWVSKLIIK